MSYAYIFGLSLLLLFYVFYHYFTSLRWDERDIRGLENVELHLGNILRLLDAPDVRLLLDRAGSRQTLLMEFSDCLRKDVLLLLRLRAVGLASLPWVGIFFLSYYVIRVKSRLRCGRDDLRFLSALELTLFRTLAQN
jgi:hypothetical protein